MKNVIVITRPEKENKRFKEQLEKEGFSVFAYPAITISANRLTREEAEAIKGLHRFDWLVLTSVNGVNFFFTFLKENDVDVSILRTKKIAVVGSQTAKALERYGFQAAFMPSKFTTDALAAEIKNISGLKFLLPRSEIASPLLTKTLQAKGATVINIPIYKTNYSGKMNDSFFRLVKENKIKYITFTSPSTVAGFLQSIPEQILEEIFKLPVLSIGPVTTDEARKVGFTNIVTADEHTTHGMIQKLRA